MDKWYVFTLDSHDCFGPFASYDAAVQWGKVNRPTFQVLRAPPYRDTLILRPF